MLLLAADTSGKQGSIGLAQAPESLPANSAVEIIEVVSLAGGAFSAQLIPQVAALLTKHGFSKSHIDGFVIASGPGSFTGLRVGLAAIKALAEILGKPIAAVSLLEALALASGSQGRIIAALDAGRGEVYAGGYEVQGHAATLIKEQLLTKTELLAEAGQSVLVTSDQSLAEAAAALGRSVLRVEGLNAGSIAVLGWRKITAGNTVLPENLEANYIRRTDAELLAKLSQQRS